ncbi:MAG: hypothetical protein HZC23_13290 [Rhodocyclales bacterium]|nr:hypothetical protein [Rhodocyclales bacterium]
MKREEKKLTPVLLIFDRDRPFEQPPIGAMQFADGSVMIEGHKSQPPYDGEGGGWEGGTHMAANNYNWRCAT